VYCGPLRLLAVEVTERLNQEGLPCSLVTGQERINVAGARHVACTVEMASTTNLLDVAVIDEIQVRCPPEVYQPCL
jgi:ATP-dependent RNA helicase SUPV3L1/SUV3